MQRRSAGAFSTILGRLPTVLLAALLSWGCGSGDNSTDPAIQQGTILSVEAGDIQGTSTGSVRMFLGLPYAAAPVGDLRWRPPRPADRHQNVLDGTAVPPVCPQLDLITGQPTRNNSSEDCLFLNVWTPDPAPASPLPVMVWLHGGDFRIGSGFDGGSFDGGRLVAAGDVVVVTLNYRLGPLGFLAHPALSEEDERGVSGNYGILDQRMALEWVQRNITAFGGNRENVTIFGASAGGISVCIHLVSPGSCGLFHRAISQSGPCSAITATLGEAQEQGEALAASVGCDSVECLRNKSPLEILGGLPSEGILLWNATNNWYPNVDGVELPSEPQRAVERGDVAGVPTILGTTTDEGQLFTFLAQVGNIDEREYEAIVRSGPVTAEDAGRILEAYPPDRYDTAADALAAALSDQTFRCPMRRAATGLASTGSPSYLYEFAEDPGLFIKGAFHGTEVPFVFGNAAAPIFPEPSLEVQHLVSAIQGYWTRFASTGDPNRSAGGSVFWPEISAQSGGVLRLAVDDVRVVGDDRDMACLND